MLTTSLITTIHKKVKNKKEEAYAKSGMSSTSLSDPQRVDLWLAVVRMASWINWRKEDNSLEKRRYFSLKRGSLMAAI